MEEKEWYRVHGIEKIDTPALLVYSDRVLHNIRLAISMLGDVNRLRPHIKTNKSPEAVRMMIAEGISRFKCSTIAEAEMLAMEKAADVLMAYQPAGPKLDRFIQLIKGYPSTRFSCLVDNEVSLLEQQNTCKEQEVTLQVFIDLNNGMNRTGIIPDQSAFGLYLKIQESSSVEFAGLHVYDGHIRDTDFDIRKQWVESAMEPVLMLRDQIAAAVGKVPVLITGGSPSFPVHALSPDRECSPGTFIYWDKGYMNICPEQHFLPAAILITRVISHPLNGLLTTDLGHKSVASENEISRRIAFLNAPGLEILSQSEEHMVAKTDPSFPLPTGELLFGIPWHVCPTVALYESSVLVSENRITGEWSHIARNRKITI